MCDTFVVLPPASADGTVILGKNSDREANEAQALEYHPPAEHPEGARLECTYRSVPQLRHTRGVLISRPFWMWGAEMGVNDAGVAIGNEAVFTRMPKSREPRLLGMDMLRIALERGGSATDALRIVLELLAEYGQGGVAGYEDRNFTYHNSFLIADRREAWVLETADHLWAAKRVSEYYAISNVLTIGRDYDRAHPELCRRNRSLRRGRRGGEGDAASLSVGGESGFEKRCDFARRYRDPLYHLLTGGRSRRSRAEELIRRRIGAFGPADALAILRDHGEANPVGARDTRGAGGPRAGGDAARAGGARAGGSYRPDRHLLATQICAHAANPLTRNSSQSVGSMVVRLGGDVPEVWATGTSAPCTSLFKPIWLAGEVLPDLGPAPRGSFDPETLWWRHERVHRRAIRNLPEWLGPIAERRSAVEAELLRAAGEVGREERFALTRRAFEAGERLDEELLELPAFRQPRRRGRPLFRRYWGKINARAGFDVAGFDTAGSAAAGSDDNRGEA